MHLKSLLAAAVAVPLIPAAAETVLGVYIFSRHGDRTAKILGNDYLTDLGYEEVFTSGTYFRDQYIANGSTSQIYGISPDVVNYQQIAASAPFDNVLTPSAQGFLQGLYPPVGPTLGSQVLRNGTTVESPMGGFQLIPVQVISSASGSESQIWLQGSTGCALAEESSNEYFTTSDYFNLLNSTADFYQSLSPVINATFAESAISYFNAYAIFDLVNVALIHNATIPDSDLLTPSAVLQLQTLADHHEFSLAYNASSPIRAITGATIGAQILEALNSTITAKGSKASPLINIQFGAYAGFLSFFGLAGLTQANPEFYGLPDYASTMTFELVTNSSVSTTAYPSVDDISVRFLWHNHTTSNYSTPTPVPLFGQDQTLLSWNDFAASMNNFSIGSQEQWCKACGNTTGVCASTTSSGSPSPSSTSNPGSSSSSSSGGISNAVAGVIGAMVTLAVILGVEALIMLIAGLRLVNKKRIGAGGVAQTGATMDTMKA